MKKLNPLIILVVLTFVINFGDVVPTLGQANSTPARVVAWSPDNTKIALGGGGSGCGEVSEQFAVHIIDVTTDQTLLVLLGHSCRIADITWSPDGTKIATSAADGFAKVWDANNGTLISTTILNVLQRGKLAWSPDSNKIANTWMGQPIFEVWDIATGDTHFLASVNGNKFIGSLDWEANGSRIVSGGGSDNSVRIWDSLANPDVIVPSGVSLMTQSVATLVGHTDVVENVDWGQDGNIIISSSFDETIRVWNATTGDTLHVLQSGCVWEMELNPDSTIIAAAICGSETLHFWNTATGAEIATVQSTAGIPLSLDWSPDGEKLAYVGTNSTTSGDNLQIIDAPEPPLSVTSFTLMNSGTNADIQTITNGETIDLSLAGTQFISIRANTSGEVGSVAFSVNGALPNGDNSAPFALSQTPTDDYTPWYHRLQSNTIYTLKATPYSGPNLSGTMGTPYEISFSFIASQPTHRINVGGSELNAGDSSLPVWSRDTASNPSPHVTVVGGRGSTSATPTYATAVPTAARVANVQRYYQIGEMEWDFSVNPGQYEVRLYFMEPQESITTGERKFHIYIEGNKVANQFDIYATAGTHYKTIMQSYTVNVDSHLDLDFVATAANNPLVSAIEIIRTS